MSMLAGSKECGVRHAEVSGLSGDTSRCFAFSYANMHKVGLKLFTVMVIKVKLQPSLLWEKLNSYNLQLIKALQRHTSFHNEMDFWERFAF